MCKMFDITLLVLLNNLTNINHSKNTKLFE